VHRFQQKGLNEPSLEEVEAMKQNCFKAKSQFQFVKKNSVMITSICQSGSSRSSKR